MFLNIVKVHFLRKEWTRSLHHEHVMPWPFLLGIHNGFLNDLHINNEVLLQNMINKEWDKRGTLVKVWDSSMSYKFQCISGGKLILRNQLPPEISYQLPAQQFHIMTMDEVMAQNSTPAMRQTTAASSPKLSLAKNMKRFLGLKNLGIIAATNGGRPRAAIAHLPGKWLPGY